MATSNLSFISTSHLLTNPTRSSTTSLILAHKNRRAARIQKSVDLVVRNATPEVAGDLLSSTLSLPGLPLHPEGDQTTWFASIAAMCVTVPLMIQRLLSLTKEVDAAAQMVEKIADTVEDVAEKVDKAAEEFGAALPDGGLKKMVHLVEVLAEETAKDAQIVEDLMDKVEEVDDKLEEFLNTKFKGPETKH